MPSRDANIVAQLSIKIKTVSPVVRAARQVRITHKMPVQAATIVQEDNTKIKIPRQDANTVVTAHIRIREASRDVKDALEGNT